MCGSEWRRNGLQTPIDPRTSQTCVKTLYLRENDIGPTGAEYLGACLGKFKHLREFDISLNSINSSGLNYLSMGLCNTKELVKLDIGGNNIGSIGINYLSHALVNCINLQFLGLSENQISSAGMVGIENIMSKCCHLHTLDLHDNHLTMDDAAALVNHWNQSSLLHIDLGYSLGMKHESRLVEGEGCCDQCLYLLQLYFYTDNVEIKVEWGIIPKLLQQ